MTKARELKLWLNTVPDDTTVELFIQDDRSFSEITTSKFHGNVFVILGKRHPPYEDFIKNLTPEQRSELMEHMKRFT